MWAVFKPCPGSLKKNWWGIPHSCDIPQYHHHDGWISQSISWFTMMMIMNGDTSHQYIYITSYSNGFTNILVNKNYHHHHHHHHQPSSTIGSRRTTTRPPTISLQHLGAQRLASPWRWVRKWWCPSLKILLKWRISLRILLRIYW